MTKDATNSQAPVIENNIRFQDIFDLDDLQRLQDLFSDAMGVASIITQPDGTPITKPSNFSRLCKSIIRKTEKGLANCMYSDAQIGRHNPSGPIVQPCLSCGLWDAGANIIVGGKQIANWLIGQVRNDALDMESIRKYASEIGTNEEEFLAALSEVPVMSTERFHKISEMLFAFAGEISEKAYQNLLLKKQIEESEEAFSLLKQSEEKYSTIFNNVQDVFYQTDVEGIVREISPSIRHFSEFNRDEIIGTNVSDLYYNPDDRNILLDKISKTGELLDYEIILKTKSGSKKYVSINARLVFDTKGRPTHIDGALRDITERKQQEKEYKQLIDAMNDTAFVINFEGKFVEINKAAVEVLGYSREEFLTMSVMDLDPRLSENEIMDLIDGMKLEERQVFETQHKTKRGEIISVEISSSPVFFHGKEAILSVARDITERKQAMDTILLARQSYVDIFNSVSEAIYIQDETGAFIDVNHGAEKMYGCSRDFLIGKTPADVAAPGLNDLEKTQSMSHDVFETGIPARFGFWAVRSDGDVFPKEVIVNKGKYFDKDVLIATARDISQQKQSEELIRESEEKYRLLAENVTDVIWTMDIHGKYHYVSPSVYALRGITAQECMKETMFESLAPKSAKDAYKLYKEYAKNISKGEKTEPGILELEVLCKNGSTVWTEINISAVYSEKGSFKYFLGVTRDITQRRKTEKALRESEKRKKDILKAIPDLLFLFNPKGDYVEVISGNNDRLILNKDEIVGKNIADIFPVEIARKALKAIEKCFSKKQQVEFSYSLIINGETLFYEARLIPASDNKVLAIVRDITELKNVEAYRDKQHLYSKALNEVAEIIISNDNAVEILEQTNAVVGSTLQLDRSLIYHVSFKENKITGLSEWLRLEHPEIEATKGEYPLDMFLSPFSEILQTKKYLVSHFNAIGEPFKRDESGRTLHEHFKIKSLIWYPFFFNENEYHVFTLNQILDVRHWTDEEFGFLDSVAKQITLALIKIQLLSQRQQAEESMHKSYKLLNRLAAQVPGVVYQYRLYPDGHSSFPYASPGIWDIYEVTPDEVQEDATVVFGRIHPEDLSRVSDTIFESARKQSLYHEEFRVILPEQGLRWRLCDAKPELLGDGSTLWHGIITDISHRKMVEEELVKAKDKAEESDRLKSAFLMNMSHEIRTPMNGILGFISLLEEPDTDEESRKGYIDIVNKSGQRLLDTINDIIEISRIESGELNVKMEEVNIEELMKFQYDFFRPQALEKNVDFEMHEYVKGASAIIQTDRHKLNGILTNLIKNAVKFTTHGFIKIGSKIENDSVEFYVKDSGRGIPANRVEAIFDQFVQADISITRAHEGTGLGLSIVKAYVQALGGKIGVESKEGKGSIFRFSIPFISSKSEAVPDFNREIDAESSLKGLTILVAEDDEPSYQFIEVILAREGANIIRTEDGRGTIEALKANPSIHLILMDIKMPGMDGLEATKRIRQFNTSIPIIAQTAHAFVGEKTNAHEAGCNDYISKPIDKDKLLDIINVHIINSSA